MGQDIFTVNSFTPKIYVEQNLQSKMDFDLNG